MDSKHKIPIVVLNWNKSELTISLIKNLEEIEGKNLDLRYIIVDNNSKVEEREKLVKFANREDVWKILDENEAESYEDNENQLNILLLLKDNYGYAKGNNFGLELAYRLGYKYCVVSNNDVVIEKPVINKLLEILEQSKNIGAIGPKIIGPRGENQGPFREPSLYDYFFYPIFYPFIWPIKKVILKNKNNYKNKFPYRLMGCFLVVDLAVFKKIDWFDENTFLYAEELILAEKFKKIGYRMAYEDSVYIKHLHGVSTEELGNKNRILQQLKSDQYYFKEYRNFGQIKLFLVKVGFLYSNFILIPVVKKVKKYFGFLQKSEDRSK